MARRADLTIISERSQEADSICRLTVSSECSLVSAHSAGEDEPLLRVSSAAVRM